MSPDWPDDVTEQVAWPAVLCREGKERLILVSSQDEWELDPELSAGPFQDGDRLIDSAGTLYRLGEPGSNIPRLEPTGETCTHAEFQEIAERHLESIGAPPDWLAAHLQDIPEGHRVRATVRYLERFENDGAEETPEEE